MILFNAAQNTINRLLHLHTRGLSTEIVTDAEADEIAGGKIGWFCLILKQEAADREGLTPEEAEGADGPGSLGPAVGAGRDGGAVGRPAVGEAPGGKDFSASISKTYIWDKEVNLVVWIEYLKPVYSSPSPWITMLMIL